MVSPLKIIIRLPSGSNRMVSAPGPNAKKQDEPGTSKKIKKPNPISD